MAAILNLVTGGAGFIGSNLCRALLARGERVRVLDNFSTGHRENLGGLPIELLEGDARDPAACSRACAGADFVFHQAALPSVPRSLEQPLESHEHCATATLTMLQAARQAGVRRFLYAGSSSAYGNSPSLPKVESMTPAPRSPYAAAKLAGEYYCRVFTENFGLETVTLRYFNIFGPRQDPDSPYSGVLSRFITRLLAGESCTIYGDGETSRDFTYIDNVIAANLRARDALAAPGNIYNVGCGRKVTLNWVYDFIAQETGVTRRPEYGPPRAGDVRDSLAEISAAGRDLGYHPAVDVEEGLRRTIQWYREALRTSAPAALSR